LDGRLANIRGYQFAVPTKAPKRKKAA
jgi:hypothetical protein